MAITLGNLYPNNANLRRIAELDRQIAAIKKIIDNGEHIAAGLSIDVLLGPVTGNEREDQAWVRTELCWQTDLILVTIHDSLVQSRTQAIKAAAKERDELRAFFDTHDAG
jgi:hypothetical protein